MPLVPALLFPRSSAVTAHVHVLPIHRRVRLGMEGGLVAASVLLLVATLAAHSLSTYTACTTVLTALLCGGCFVHLLVRERRGLPDSPRKSAMLATLIVCVFLAALSDTGMVHGQRGDAPGGAGECLAPWGAAAGPLQLLAGVLRAHVLALACGAAVCADAGLAVLCGDPLGAGQAGALAVGLFGSVGVGRGGGAGGVDGDAVRGGAGVVEAGQGLSGGCGDAVTGVWGLGYGGGVKTAFSSRWSWW